MANIRTEVKVPKIYIHEFEVGEIFDMTAENATAQNRQVGELPAGTVITQAYIVREGDAMESTGTLTTAPFALGTASAGVEIIASTDLKAANARVRAPDTKLAVLTPKSTPTAVWLQFGALTGAGNTFDALTVPGKVKVIVHYEYVEGNVT